MRILLLEDEFLIAIDVEETCRDSGAKDVLIARSLAEAEEAAALHKFDAAIVDIMLGGDSTLDFASTLQTRDLPFVFASGYSDLSEIDSRFPGVRVMAKPYAARDLVEALSAAIAGPATPARSLAR